LEEKPQRIKALSRPKHGWEKIKMDLKETEN
jgi:hypothetical protein